MTGDFKCTSNYTAVAGLYVSLKERGRHTRRHLSNPEIKLRLVGCARVERSARLSYFHWFIVRGGCDSCNDSYPTFGNTE